MVDKLIDKKCMFKLSALSSSSCESPRSTFFQRLACGHASVLRADHPVVVWTVRPGAGVARSNMGPMPLREGRVQFSLTL